MKRILRILTPFAILIVMLAMTAAAVKKLYPQLLLQLLKLHGDSGLGIA